MTSRLRPFGQVRPPSVEDRGLQRFLQDIVSNFNQLPYSFFSTSQGPNASAVTAPTGTLGVEIGSGVEKLWVKVGESRTTGWHPVTTQDPNSFLTISAGSQIPDFTSSTNLRTANTSLTTIHSFQGASNAREIRLLFGDDLTKVAFSSSVTLYGNARMDFSAKSGDFLKAFSDGTLWFCEVSETSA